MLEIKWTFGLLLISFILALTNCQDESVSPSPNCTSFYRSFQRSGAFISGQLTIPMSESLRQDATPGFKLRMKFNRAVRALQVRQVMASPMGNSHTDFMIDTRARAGKLRINTMMQLPAFLSPPARPTRIIFNDKHLCGAPLSQSEANESVIVNAVFSKRKITTTSSTPISEFIIQTESNMNEDYY